jgi:3-hydroxybutyryl-CoA dehydrogenase
MSPFAVDELGRLLRQMSSDDLSTKMTKPPAASREPVAVVGAGLMGHGIAQLFAASGHPVGLFDPNPEALRSAPERIRAATALRRQDPAIVDNVRCCTFLADAVAGAHLVIESGPEQLQVKRDILRQLEELTDPTTILASGTSAIPISEIAAEAQHPERVVGTHFWNPPHLVPLVEVVQGNRTSEATVERTMALLAAAGKSPVHVRRDVPGFIGNRLQHALKREAIALVAEGVCDAAAVDRVVREGFGARLAVLGPLEQSDLVGLDLTLAIHQTLMPSLDRRAEPHPLLVRLVAEGKTGMKAGEGFYRWTPEHAAAVRRRLDNFLAGGVAKVVDDEEPV